MTVCSSTPRTFAAAPMLIQSLTDVLPESFLRSVDMPDYLRNQETLGNWPADNIRYPTAYVNVLTEVLDTPEDMANEDEVRRIAEGKRIAQARRLLGVRVERDISQGDLAVLVGVAGNSIVWNWEEGIKSPLPKNRTQLSRVLGVTEAYLNYGTEPRELEGWTPPDISVLEPSNGPKDARDVPPRSRRIKQLSPSEIAEALAKAQSAKKPTPKKAAGGRKRR